MFGIKKAKIVRELTNMKARLNWMKFSEANSSEKTRKDFLEEIITDNKFIREDLKIRAMVEEMLVKEFSSDIKNIKSYDYLVDSVVNRLKKKELDSSLSGKEIKKK